MSNVSHLRGEEKKRLLSKTYGNSPILYLDCGVFQKFKSKFSETEIVKDREKLIRLFNILQPNSLALLTFPH